jgi:hypothetical protein
MTRPGAPTYHYARHADSAGYDMAARGRGGLHLAEERGAHINRRGM